MKTNNNIEEQKLNYQKTVNIIFLAITCLITIGAIMFVWVNLGQPFKIGSLKEMKEVTYENYNSQKGIKNDKDETVYYLYIYSENYNRNNWYENIVIEYANYARTHSSATPIYALNYDLEGNNKILSDLGSSTKLGTDIPGLVLIKNGGVSTKFFTWTKLNNELSTAMGK